MRSWRPNSKSLSRSRLSSNSKPRTEVFIILGNLLACSGRGMTTDSPFQLTNGMQSSLSYWKWMPSDESANQQSTIDCRRNLSGGAFVTAETNEGKSFHG